MRLIDANALFAVVKGHHDLYNGATNPADKARRDECLQVMCDINDAPTIDAIHVEWLEWRIMNAKYNGIKEAADAFEFVLKCWKEQEAR